MEFKYQPISAFSLLLTIAEYGLDSVDAFFEQAKRSSRSEQKNLEQRIESIGGNAPDEDWWVDDFAQLEEFTRLSAEFAIVGLWRCIELYRKRAMRAALGDAAARRSFKHRKLLYCSPLLYWMFTDR